MKFVPVDASRLEAVFIDAVPKLRDKVQQINAEGVPVWACRVMCRWLDTDDKPEIIEVAIASRTNMSDNLQAFQHLELQGLKTFPWQMEGRSGLAFSADGARTIKPKTNGTKPVETAGVAS